MMKQKIKQLIGIFILGGLLLVGASSMRSATSFWIVSSEIVLGFFALLSFFAIYSFSLMVYRKFTDRRDQLWVALALSIIPLVMIVVSLVEANYIGVVFMLEHFFSFVMALILLNRQKYVRYGVLLLVAYYFVFMMMYGYEHLFKFIEYCTK